MSKKLILAVVLFLALPVSHSAFATIYRYGVFVGSSKGFNESNLPEAAGVAAGVADLFKEYCLLDESLVLTDPGPEELDNAFARMKELVEARSEGAECHFFFYYYGHGQPEGLLLNYKIYEKERLKAQVAAVGAKLRFVFLDSCKSQVLSGADEELDFSSTSEGTVYITSSTQFQKAYAGVFTPILKAGLMGDADGYIPDQIDAPFFYKEVISRLDSKEQEFVRSLYGLSEYYRYRESSERERQRVAALFTALGVDKIPGELHISEMESRILKGINNSHDEKLIAKSYNYSRICRLKEGMTGEDEERLVQAMRKVGFKRDGYVTLSELFSYIQSRVAAKEANGQRATITTGYLDFRQPIPLSHFDNKVELHLAYPGTLFIKRVGSGGVVESLVKIVTGLDAAESEGVRLSLAPGRYDIIVETEKGRYKVEVELKADEPPLRLEQLSWSNLLEFREGDRWQSKAFIDKREQLHRRTAWIAPTLTFTSLAVPLSIFLTEIGYSRYLYDSYKQSTDINEIAALRQQITEYQEVRNYFYLASGLTLTLHVIPFVIWMVQIAGAQKMKNEIKALKERYLFRYLPELQIGSEELGLAINIKFN